MDRQTDQNLRIYNRQLAAKLNEKERDSNDLQMRFSKLQGRFAQLEYAFKENLQLHQEQMFTIQDLRLTQKELRKVDKDRWEKLCKLEDEITSATNEREAFKNGLAYWKQAVIDQEKFYEGKFEECLRVCKLKTEADEIAHQRTFNETQTLAEKHIKELADLLKVEKQKGEAIREKGIISQGDVDVLRYRTQELACLIENFPGINEDLQAIGSCIAKVLRSLNSPHDDYEDRIKELHEELLRGTFRPVEKPERDTSDYETLKSQNLVLREVVKKLKNELNNVQKSEAIISKTKLVEENKGIDDLRKELLQSNLENEKLSNSIVKKDAEFRKLETESKKNIAELKTSLELMKSRENERQSNSSKSNIGANKFTTRGKAAVKDDENFVSYSEIREGREFNNDESQEAYLRLQKGEVKKFKEQTTGNMMESLELNLETLNSGESFGKNYVTLQDEEKVEDNTGSCLNDEKIAYSKLTRGRLEPIESHLNSVEYKEYTIPLSKNHRLKIRHPKVRKSTEEEFRFRSVYSEKEYESIPIDETVFYFSCKNGETVFAKSKIANCSVQTIPIPKTNVFTQATILKETFNSQGSNGVKILNSERRAIERSLRNLEKTVFEAGEESLGLARSLIVDTRRFPPSEEFFDCIKYLSQCRAT